MQPRFFIVAARTIQAAALAWLSVCSCLGQAPGQQDLQAAYQSLGAKDYDRATAEFRSGLAQQPRNAAAHKDFAYTLLKAGANADARDEFEAALSLNPQDETAALEFAFLAFETGKPVEARRMFDRLRKTGSATARVTAERAFQNIDVPLAEGIERWKQALQHSPNPLDPNLYSAHLELARLAELRDEFALSAEQYEICRRLKPDKTELLISLAHVWRGQERLEDVHAALLAASRSNDPRTAENALDEMGPRYPYPYEFVNALAIDPTNVSLRRELAYLYLALGKQAQAIEQFRKVLEISPDDRVARDQLDALTSPKKPVVKAATTTSATSAIDARAMGLKSFALGYSRDAIKYLLQAHDEDPNDGEVMLKLGYAYNYAKDDADAVIWFDRARHCGDPQIAAEAQKAYRNLTGQPSALLTIWTLPMYSSRWHDVFDYGQVKRSIPLPWNGVNRWLSFYLSARFTGDWRSSMPQSPYNPQYLSDSDVIFGAGIASKTWHHLTGWMEAGEAVKYLPFRHDTGTAYPDYRGGINFAKGFGHLLGGAGSGEFFETSADAVFVSRYNNDVIMTVQNRGGRTMRLGEGTSAQLLWNANVLHDLKNQYWAEAVETGPGLRLHMPWMAANTYFSADFLRGVYTNNLDNPRRPNYNDIRIGFWYAISR